MKVIFQNYETENRDFPLGKCREITVSAIIVRPFKDNKQLMIRQVLCKSSPPKDIIVERSVLTIMSQIIKEFGFEAIETIIL